MYILFRLFSSVVYHRLLNVVPWTSCLSYAVCPEDECSLFPHQLAYLIGYILPPSIRSFCFKFQLWVSNSRFRGNGSPWPQLRMSSGQWIFVVQSLSRVRFFATPWTAARQAPLSFTISQGLLKLMSIRLIIPPIISQSVTLC